MFPVVLIFFFFCCFRPYLLGFFLWQWLLLFFGKFLVFQIKHLGQFFVLGFLVFFWRFLWLYAAKISGSLPGFSSGPRMSEEHTLLLSEKNKALLEKQDYEIYAATLRERNRIAREIHDNVGHVLSRSILMTAACKPIKKMILLILCLEIWKNP